jgi:hypothetical protein
MEPVLALASKEPRFLETRANSLRPTWSSGVEAIFEVVKRTDELVQALFAGAGLNGASVDSAAGELRGEFVLLDSNRWGRLYRSDERPPSMAIPLDPAYLERWASR